MPKYCVRRQGFWNQRRPNLRESLAHLVDLIMRLAGGDASISTLPDLDTQQAMRLVL